MGYFREPVFQAPSKPNENEFVWENPEQMNDKYVYILYIKIEVMTSLMCDFLICTIT